MYPRAACRAAMSLATTWNRYVDMDTTLSRSSSSSNCSASVGVIRPLIKTVRFSLRMEEEAGRGRETSPAGKEPAPQEEGWGTLAGRLNYGGSMRLIALLVLAGCASNSITPTSKHFTIEHGTMRFGSALSQAKRHCESLGMETKHTNTQATGFYMVSSFECVPK